MTKLIRQLAISVLAIIFLIAIYALGVSLGGSKDPVVVAAYNDTMPVEPNIIFLAPSEMARGAVDALAMEERGAIVVLTWHEVQDDSVQRPLDALLIDQIMIDSATKEDIDWLRERFHDGVVIVGLGVDDNEFAHVLGQETFLAPGERGSPLGVTGYRLVYGLIMGNPDDIDGIGNWIERYIREEDNFEADITYPMVQVFGKARGQLDSDSDLDLLFTRLRNHINGIYQTRADFREVMNGQGDK